MPQKILRAEKGVVMSSEPVDEPSHERRGCGQPAHREDPTDSEKQRYREARGNEIIADYQKYLGRTPDANGMNTWLSVLAAGGRQEDVISGILASPEYVSHHGGTNAGFVSQGPEAERAGMKFEVERKGNGNQGHEFGVALPQQDKDALIEYLKTL